MSVHVNTCVWVCARLWVTTCMQARVCQCAWGTAMWVHKGLHARAGAACVHMRVRGPLRRQDGSSAGAAPPGEQTDQG